MARQALIPPPRNRVPTLHTSNERNESPTAMLLFAQEPKMLRLLVQATPRRACWTQCTQPCRSPRQHPGCS